MIILAELTQEPMAYRPDHASSRGAQKYEYYSQATSLKQNFMHLGYLTGHCVHLVVQVFELLF